MVLGSEDFSAAKPSLQCGWVLGLRSGVAVDLTLDRDSCRLQGLCRERACCAPQTLASPAGTAHTGRSRSALVTGDAEPLGSCGGGSSRGTPLQRRARGCAHVCPVGGRSSPSTLPSLAPSWLPQESHPYNPESILADNLRIGCSAYFAQ